MVEVIRALSNPEVAARIDAAVDALDRLLASGSEKPAGRSDPLPLAHGTLRREILQVLRDAHEALRPIEVRRRVERRIGRPVDPHSIVGSLNNGSRDPDVPIVRVSRGRYGIAEWAG
jgi:hypothetical protein